MRASRRPSYLLLVLVSLIAAPAAGYAVDTMVDIPGATFLKGDPAGEPDEAPATVSVKTFRLMRTEVTNAQFARFVEATGHRTDPERREFGYVWDGRWQRVAGADWRHPFGPDAGIAGRDDHPVVQV